MAHVWDPVRYARDAGYVARLGTPVVDLLAPLPGERILDLGCGDGELTQNLTRAGAEVIGLDACPAFVARARERGLSAQTGDGRQLAFAGEFDAVFSNAALHWMGDLAAVAGGVRRALRPHGRFVGELGGEGNVATVMAALTAALARRGIDAAGLNPWVFPDAETFSRLLVAHGFAIEHLHLFPRPTPLPGDLADWLAVFAGAFLAAVPDAERPHLVNEVRTTLVPCLRDERGVWWVDYVRLRFRAVVAAAGAPGYGHAVRGQAR